MDNFEDYNEEEFPIFEEQKLELSIPSNMSGIFAILKKSKLITIELWNLFVGKKKRSRVSYNIVSNVFFSL